MSLRGLEAPPLSRANIASASNRTREYFGLQNGDYFPIVDILELCLPKVIPDYVFDVADRDEMRSNHGLTHPDKNLIKIRLDVYEGACNGKGRDRFTLAHELGHLIMHSSVPLARPENTHDIPSYKCTEWQANCFAGELLMPKNRLITCRDTDEAMERFGVTRAAAEYQFKFIKK